MIAGEIENIIGADEGSYVGYDDFFGLGKNKNKKGRTKSIALMNEKRKNRRQFGQGLGNFFSNNGGLAGVTDSFGKIVNIARGNPTDSVTTSGPPVNYPTVPNGNESLPKDDKKISTEMYVVGGALAIGLILVASKMMGNKTTPPTQ